MEDVQSLTENSNTTGTLAVLPLPTRVNPIRWGKTSPTLVEHLELVSHSREVMNEKRALISVTPGLRESVMRQTLMASTHSIQSQI